MLDEDQQQFAQIENLGNAVHQGQHVDAEAGLKLGVLVELVHDDFRMDARAVSSMNDAHALAIGLVAEGRDALDALFANAVADALQQAGLVDLEGNGRDDQRLAVALPRSSTSMSARIRMEPRPVR